MFLNALDARPHEEPQARTSNFQIGMPIWKIWSLMILMSQGHRWIVKAQRLLFDSINSKWPLPERTLWPLNHRISQSLKIWCPLRISISGVWRDFHWVQLRTESRNRCLESSFQSRTFNVVFRLSLGQKIELARGLGQKPDFRDEWSQHWLFLHLFGPSEAVNARRL